MSENWTIEERAVEKSLLCVLNPNDPDDAELARKLANVLIAFAREVAEEAARVADQRRDSASAISPGEAIRRRFGLEDKP